MNKSTSNSHSKNMTDEQLKLVVYTDPSRYYPIRLAFELVGLGSGRVLSVFAPLYSLSRG